jgi:hypothetical protein
MKPTKRVLFMGLGNMGFPMANNLASTGNFMIDAYDPMPITSSNPNVRMFFLFNWQDKCFEIN